MSKKEIISEALYRKYRPQNFDEVLGQEEVVESLRNSLKNQKISHAYLFSGGRGSGKTSIARIFASELGVSPDDIYEIDAASNRGIDQIRELRNSVEILPISSSHKVYIIDEVHMLTKEAFNALLKTLEEPPRHIIFILATTEKNKILDTILSRCQTFDFKKADKESLKELIKIVSQKEGVEVDSEALDYLAVLGNGSFRDTLSHLQKAISILGSDIKINELKEKLLISEDNLSREFLKALSDRKTEDLLSAYAKILEKDFDLNLFIDEIIFKIRASLLMKYSKDFDGHFSNYFSDEEIGFLKELEFNSLDLKNILETSDLAKKSERPEVALEIFLGKLMEK